MLRNSGYADLPLHSGTVPKWLADRMMITGTLIVESIIQNYGVDEVLVRLSDPLWFQSFGAVMGMDWHSSGITTSVMYALKRGLNPRAKELGVYVCGGRGKYSRQTPNELLAIGEETGLDADRLVRNSKLVAKIDNNAVQDGFQLYQHNFILTKTGNWTVIQQGMNASTKNARRYHWCSADLRSFVENPHTGVVGDSQGQILNLTDKNARPTRDSILEMSLENPERILKEIGAIGKPASEMILLSGGKPISINKNQPIGQNGTLIAMTANSEPQSASITGREENPTADFVNSNMQIGISNEKSYVNLHTYAPAEQESGVITQGELFPELAPNVAFHGNFLASGDAQSSQGKSHSRKNGFVEIEMKGRNLVMPRHHEVLEQDVDLKRLGGVLAAAYESQPKDFESLMLTPGLGPRTLQSLTLVSEVIYGTPSRFSDPARFSFAHGGKDGHPFPVPLKVYDASINILRDSIEKSKLGYNEKSDCIKRLHQTALFVEKNCQTEVDFDKAIEYEKGMSDTWDGRMVSGKAG